MAKRRSRRALYGFAGAAALALAACGGGADAPAGPAGGSAAPDAPGPTTPAAQATQDAQDGRVADAAATPQAPAATVEAETVTVEPRTDGLTGAPVAQTTAESAAFDQELVNDRGGAFPPLDEPLVVTPGEAPWMEADHLVLGAVQNGEARAYPLFMMTFHRVANDTLGGEPYLVTF